MPKREAIVTLPNFQFPFRIFTNYMDFEKSSVPEYQIENSISMYSQRSGEIIPPKREISTNPMNLTPIQEKKLNLSNLFLKIEQILKQEPQNKDKLSKQLLIPKNELDELLKPLLQKKAILTCIAPFNSMLPALD